MNESEASPVGDYLLSSVKQVVLGWFTEGAKTAKSLIEVTGNLPPWGYYGPPPSGWTGQGASSPSLDTINGVDQGTGNLPPWGYYGPPPSGWTGQGTGKTNDGFAYEWTGTHVTPEFKAKVLEICAKLKMNPDDLMAVMAFESGGINPAAVNKDSGATGLIQFMPSTARSLETTTEALAKMSDVEQLDYVYQYLEPYTGKLNTVQDAYMAVFMPIAVGKSNDFVLGIKDSKEELAKGLSYGIVYKQNAGLDKNGDGIITKEEAAQKVVDKRNTYKKIN
ncbi:transglycosylase SLT domain-containing protein [Anaerobacterium chartisolvens]|nr:transglycosylase SLT domain-containing protein [Anaerobacterium chartisolvens]